MFPPCWPSMMTMLTIGNFQNVQPFSFVVSKNSLGGPDQSHPNRTFAQQLWTWKILGWVCPIFVWLTGKPYALELQLFSCTVIKKMDGTVPAYWFIFGPFTSTYLLVSVPSILTLRQRIICQISHSFFCRSSEPTVFPNSQFNGDM